MDRRTDRRWLVFAVVGSLLAVFLGFVALPLSLPATTPLQVGPMHDYGATDVQVVRPGEPARSPQPVPDFSTEPSDVGPHYTMLSARADWTGGAVVTCDISAFMADIEGEKISSSAAVDQDLGLDEGQVDMLSRSTSVVGGRLTIVVAQPAGTSRVFLQRGGDDVGPGQITGRWLQVRWAGAEPGKTNSCDGVWERDTATARITVVDHDGSPFPEDLVMSEAVILVRGCGHMTQVRDSWRDQPAELTIAASTCVLQVERRSAVFPLIVARSAPTRVSAAPGEVVELTLRAPEEPPLYQPPDLVELGVLADAAAFAGSDQLTDFLDDVLADLAAGEWDPSESFGEDFREAVDEQPKAEESAEDPDRPSPAEEWRPLFAHGPTAAKLDERLYRDPDQVSSFAGMVHRGELRAEELPPKLRAAVRDVLDRRTP